MLTIVPGLGGKLEGSWKGPYEVLEVPSEMHVVLGRPEKTNAKRMGKRIHINACKPFHVASVYRFAVWAVHDEVVESHSKLKGGELTREQESELEQPLK